MGATVYWELSEMGLQEERDDAPNVQKKPQLSRQQEHDVQNVIGLIRAYSNFMQITRPNQEVPGANRNFWRQTSRASRCLRIRSISSLSSEFNSSDHLLKFFVCFWKKKGKQHLWSCHNGHSANVARLRTWSSPNRLSSLGLTVLYTAWFRLVPEPFRSSAVLPADQSLHTAHSSSPVQA